VATAPREPGPISRATQHVRSAGFWQWCLAKITAACLLLAALALLYHLLSSGSYYASEVTVTGNQLVSARQIVDLAAVSGVHILWVNGRQAADRVRMLPAVESADVRPLFPHRVAIQIEERVPVAEWQTATSTWLVDRVGHVIGPAARGSDLVRVRENRSSGAQAPDSVPAEAVRAATALRELLPPAWQPVDGTFDYAPDSGVSVGTRVGWRVRYGDDSDPALKVATFEALAAEIQRAGARVELVDVRFVGRPYYR
jgi:cell division protein FtsQ